MTILIVPGLYGSEREHWQSYWEAELDGAERVHQQNWDTPDLEAWLEALTSHVSRSPDAILIGHSLGAVLIAHLAARYPELKIGGALLVAPADPELLQSVIPSLASFAPLPSVHLGFPSVVVASHTDPYMTLDRARSRAALWGATFVDAGDAGHINVASGHGPWREGRKWLNLLPKRQRSFGQRSLRGPIGRASIAGEQPGMAPCQIQ
ncbi:RBBP9/YdeN family alpha/beta hydrolase [Microvirga zambiensis]|uniref:RBBP9/YdeN family alpha/beta hydrolase n=1 Tax=Microvirga zambiensis TaxID=1402137 RepID=UPI00191F42B2|nr:alpha/beta hydrolase [Microvirga zambiensis]